MISIKKTFYTLILINIINLQTSTTCAQSNDPKLQEIMESDDFEIKDIAHFFTSRKDTDIAEAVLFEAIRHTVAQSFSDSANHQKKQSFVSSSLRNRPEYRSLLENLLKNPAYESLLSKAHAPSSDMNNEEFQTFLKKLKDTPEYQKFLKETEATKEYQSLVYFISESQGLVLDILHFGKTIPERLYLYYCLYLPSNSSSAKIHNIFKRGIEKSVLNDESIKIFIDKGCSLDDGLCYAIKSNSLAMAHLFLKNGANPNSCLEDGEPALSLALEQKNLKMIKLLLFYKAHPSIHNRHHALSPHNRLTEILTSDDTKNAVEIVETLLSAGFNPNDSRKYSQNTALHFAAGRNKTAVALKLLEAGANPHIADNYNDTSLSLAADKSNVAILQACLKRGVDLTDDETNYSFLLAEHKAAVNRDKEVQQLLQNARNSAKQRTVYQKLKDTSTKIGGIAGLTAIAATCATVILTSK